MVLLGERDYKLKYRAYVLQDQKHLSAFRKSTDGHSPGMPNVELRIRPSERVPWGRRPRSRKALCDVVASGGNSQQVNSWVDIMFFIRCRDNHG